MMNEKNFTMELSARTIILRWLENVVLIMAIVVIIPFTTGRTTTHIDVLVYVMFFVVLTICSLVNSTQWNAKVTEDTIHLKTIAGKRSVTFSEISSVRWNWDRKKLLFSSKNSSLDPIISILKSSNNYDKLIRRLQEHDIEGLDKLNNPPSLWKKEDKS